jgi:hypothetical protein
MIGVGYRFFIEHWRKLTLCEDGRHFRKNIRAYNNALSFTSLGIKLDLSLNGRDGSRCFKIGGQLVHDLGTILPPTEGDFHFAQIYMMSPEIENEAEHRVKVSGGKTNPRIMKKLMDMMYDYNPYALQFRNAYDTIRGNETTAICVKTIQPIIENATAHDIRTYARPSATEVVMVVGDDAEIGAADRDIVLYTTDKDWKRVSDLHTGYLPLRYPLLFPFGQQGWNEHYRIPGKTGT